MKVITILGTRPEIIRLSLTIKLLDKYINHKIIHTGQNYDYELNEVFFKDLGLRKPDYFLEVNTSTLGNIYGETIIKTEKILIKEQPDAVLILGDTNSSIAGIIAKRLQIPIYHLEAGNRSFDQNVPEEINRKIIDHIADFNIVYTERSRQHLIAEGYPHRNIYLSGSPINEIYNTYKKQLDKTLILKNLKLKKQDYFLVSIHRQENVDSKKNLKTILEILNTIATTYNRKIIFSTHPRTKDKLNSLENFKINDKIKFLKPFGFFDFLSLQINSLSVISDSGTISEESSILTGLDKEVVLKALKLVIDQKQEMQANSIPLDYQVTNTSWRIVKLILGTAKMSNDWNSITKIDK